MNRAELLSYRLSAKDSRARWTVKSRCRVMPYAYQDIARKIITPSVASAWCLEEDGGATHTVLVAARISPKSGKLDYRIWCGDTFLEGRTRTPAPDRCQTAAAHCVDPAAAAAAMMKLHGVFPTSARCDFWTLWKSPDKALCEHTQTVLAAYLDDEELDDLDTRLEALLTGSGNAPIRAPAVGREVAAESALDRLLFRVPVLVEGDRGSGKTFEAQAFARAGNHPLVKIGGHEGLEAIDLLGHYVPTADRSLAWKDGGLTQAFRQAAAGARTVLLIDELLRIPQRQLSVLLTALDPHDGDYRLRTGRIVEVVDGVGREEIVSCAVDRLAVVATTNVGADYAIDRLDPALAERWVILRKDTTTDGLTHILGATCERRGFPATVASSLVRFFELAVEMKRSQFLARTPTTRTLVRALELAATDRDVTGLLRDQALLWTARDLDGNPVPEQLATVEKLIAKAFPGTRP